MKVTQLIIIAIFFSCFFSVTSLKAEDKYSSGFIITNSNDTVRGFLQASNNNAYAKCYFKKDLADKAVEYLPGNILAYRFDDGGRFYISKEAPLESGNKMFFLEYLIKGKARVYFMRDDMDHYFMETDNKKILELSEQPKLIKLENGITYYKEAQYKGRLKYMLSDCPEILSEIDHSSLKPASMINLAKDYHNRVCNSEQCTIYERKIKPVKVQISIVGGVAFSKFEIEQSHTNTSMEGLIGCKFEFENLFFSSKRSTIQLGLIFQNYSNYTMYDENNVNTIQYALKSNLNTVAVRIPIIYKYTFSLQKIRPYIGAGLTNAFVISSNTDFSIFNSWMNSIAPFPFYQTGVIGVIGTKFMLNNKRAVNLELDYEYNQDLKSVDHLYALKSNNISIMLGYTF